jgi:hypothetical protein
MKRRRTSKTYWFAGLVTALGALQGFVPELKHAIPESAYPWLLVGVGVAVAVLREVTTDPVK